MALDDIFSALPQVLSFFAFFISLVLLFYGLRYFTSTQTEDIAKLLGYTIPALWMMMFSVYLWLIGKEDRHG